jgi:hypothetical protein
MTDFNDAAVGEISARMTDKELFLRLEQNGLAISVPRRNVRSLRDMCNRYMRVFGAVDQHGREVIDPESADG